MDGSGYFNHREKESETCERKACETLSRKVTIAAFLFVDCESSCNMENLFSCFRSIHKLVINNWKMLTAKFPLARLNNTIGKHQRKIFSFGISQLSGNSTHAAFLALENRRSLANAILERKPICGWTRNRECDVISRITRKSDDIVDYSFCLLQRREKRLFDWLEEDEVN